VKSVRMSVTDPDWCSQKEEQMSKICCSCPKLHRTVSRTIQIKAGSDFYVFRLLRLAWLWRFGGLYLDSDYLLVRVSHHVGQTTFSQGGSLCKTDYLLVSLYHCVGDKLSACQGGPLCKTDYLLVRLYHCVGDRLSAGQGESLRRTDYLQ
jgi:hypothetical protein